MTKGRIFTVSPETDVLIHWGVTLCVVWTAVVAMVVISWYSEYQTIIDVPVPTVFLGVNLTLKNQGVER